MDGFILDLIQHKARKDKNFGGTFSNSKFSFNFLALAPNIYTNAITMKQ